MYKNSLIHSYLTYGTLLLLHITRTRALFYRADDSKYPYNARWCYKCMDKNNKWWTDWADDAEIEAQ